MSRLTVFLSHLTIEKQLAEILREAITRDFIGLVDFYISSDTTSIPVGENWLSKLTEGLKKADLQFVLCSPESVKRPWITFETGAACLRGIPVIPICHSGLSPAQLPVPLSGFQAVDASARDGLLRLYQRIASELGSNIAEGKLDDLATKIREFEALYEDQIAEATKCELTRTAIGVIVSPTVLCVSSEQFMRLGIKDFETILRAFPEGVAHRRVLTSADTRTVLMQEHYDIVHVASYVCPKTGDLLFTDIDTQTGDDICRQSKDVLTSEAFCSLLRRSQTSLVVIASCESFELAATLLTVTNVVATRDIVSPTMFASWVENFYGVLPEQPLSEAFDYAVKASRAPMKLYARQDLRISSTNKQPVAISG